MVRPRGTLAVSKRGEPWEPRCPLAARSSCRAAKPTKRCRRSWIESGQFSFQGHMAVGSRVCSDTDNPVPAQRCQSASWEVRYAIGILSPRTGLDERKDTTPGLFRAVDRTGPVPDRFGPARASYIHLGHILGSHDDRRFGCAAQRDLIRGHWGHPCALYSFTEQERGYGLRLRLTVSSAFGPRDS